MNYFRQAGAIRKTRLRRTLLAALLVVEVANSGCQRNNVSRVRIKLEDPVNDRPAVARAAGPALPLCPKTMVPQLQLGSAGTGDHKVTLTWNASARSGNPAKDAYGYCLYRIQTTPKDKNSALIKQTANCAACEQINQIPVTSTGCVDDVVLDGAQYYYAVAAVNAGGVPSAPSNVVPVQIPLGRSAKPSAPSTLPLCRAGLQPQSR